MGDGGLRGHKARIIIDFPSLEKAWEVSKALQAIGLRNVRYEAITPEEGRR